MARLLRELYRHPPEDAPSIITRQCVEWVDGFVYQPAMSHWRAHPHPSNLLVVLCSEHETQPIVNAGTLYS